MQEVADIPWPLEKIAKGIRLTNCRRALFPGNRSFFPMPTDTFFFMFSLLHEFGVILAMQMGRRMQIHRKDGNLASLFSGLR
jgi:hypothetical protein